MSTVPNRRPSRGSWSGAAAHVHCWWLRTKCSAECTSTGRRATSAVPMALVPTTSSVQSAPLSKPSRSAIRRTGALPSRHSTRPSASVTTMICCAASAEGSSPSLSTGSTAASCDICRRRSNSATGNRIWGRSRSGSTPDTSTRRQDSPITARGAPEESPGGASPASTASWTVARRRAVARLSWADQMALSIALSLTLLSVVPCSSGRALRALTGPFSKRHCPGWSPGTATLCNRCRS